MNSDKIFVWAHNFSERVHTLDELRKKIDRIYDINNHCGSCQHWMTQKCNPEKIKGIFISADRLKCKDFFKEPYLNKIENKLNKEIHELEMSLKTKELI